MADSYLVPLVRLGTAGQEQLHRRTLALERRFHERRRSILQEGKQTEAAEHYERPLAA